ncbi:hypothetical protein [Alicyclobacillus sp.]|uniref:hypothetical protein n=1 Tax=Alicyclobacillus sp. TaxID=61169 RepID=UPI0025B7DB56|nr:hypothetical protein [Alicyclobacillus sp.]MCL6517266.1 hypothetical protein [Alicyclobacillus sp.]
MDVLRKPSHEPNGAPAPETGSAPEPELGKLLRDEAIASRLDDLVEAARRRARPQENRDNSSRRS